MRYGSCLNCEHGADPDLITVTAVREGLNERTHHHHTMVCGTCGSWWFDDTVTGGLGIPVPTRRDTMMCD